jgi:serine/threonine-protein kinase
MSAIKHPGLAFGATAVAALAFLGGVGTPTARADANLDKLMGLLPAGFNANNCKQVIPRSKNALATVDCHNNQLPNGPGAARFSIFPDQGTLDRSFQSNADGSVIVPCPRGQASPGPWHDHQSPDEAGQVACGVYDDTPEVMWSKNAVLLMADIQDGSIDTLFEYFSNNA